MARRSTRSGSNDGAVIKEIADLKSRLGQESNNNEFLREALAELELALEDVGWLRMSAYGDREFSIPGLKKLRRLARLSYLKNPLIKHGVDVQADYVWGQGVSISADDDDVNDCIQRFLDDPKNTAQFTGHSARLDKERELNVHGELFLPLFTNTRTGRVVVRSIYPDEIMEVICNPHDYAEPWFYKRVWSEQTFDPSQGAFGSEAKTIYYPDWRLLYNRDPSVAKPQEIAGCPVLWDAPIYHVKTGGFGDMKRGVPEVYAALDWARAVKDDLESYATQKQALARFAWQMKTKGGKLGVAAGRTKLGSTLNADGAGMLETNPPAVTGATFIGAEGWDMQPYRMAGTTISPEEGHRMWLMVASGLGLPEPILTGNADVGNLATAKALDRPTELKMENRRKLWADIYLDILGYVIDQAALAPNGMLRGSFVVDDAGEEAYVQLDGDLDRSIDIRFPSILERDALTRVQAITTAATLGNPATGSAGVLSDELVTAELMNALGKEDIDETLQEMYPGNEATYAAGRGLNEPPKPPQGVQSTVDDTGDMGNEPGGMAQGAFIPTGSTTVTDLAVVAAMREFRESIAPALEAAGVAADPLPITEAKPKARKTRSGFTLKARKKPKTMESRSADIRL